MQKTFLFFQAWLKKSIQRDNFLEALGYYHEKVLQPLVEILRIKYQPTKYDYYLKDISRDLPKEILTKLESLYKIDSMADIKSKIPKANRLFFRVANEIDIQNPL